MASREQIDWYDTPLHYDIVFDTDTRHEADFLEAVRRRHSKTRGRSVLELACGSGRLVREFSARGCRSSGFDLNPAMLQFARERLAREGLEAELWQDRMESFRVPGGRRHDLAHCLVSTFNPGDPLGGPLLHRRATAPAASESRGLRHARLPRLPPRSGGDAPLRRRIPRPRPRAGPQVASPSGQWLRWGSLPRRRLSGDASPHRALPRLAGEAGKQGPEARSIPDRGIAPVICRPSRERAEGPTYPPTNPDPAKSTGFLGSKKQAGANVAEAAFSLARPVSRT